MFKWLLVLPVLVLAVACGSETYAQSQFWDSKVEVRGNPWDFFDPSQRPSLAEFVQESDIIVTVRIGAIHDVEMPSSDHSNIIYADPDQKARSEQSDKILDGIPISTTYSGQVDTWIKGSGDSSLLVRTIGGVSAYDGSAFFLDGFFLLEPGRSYLLILHWDPGLGVYDLGLARSSFDITDGVLF